MATKKTTTGKSGVKKLKVKKETIRDLGVTSKANKVKGGAGGYVPTANYRCGRGTYGCGTAGT